MLRLINDLCKEYQFNKDETGKLDEIEVGITNFLRDHNGKNLCIKDLPGYGGEHLGDIHKELINNSIASIKNAVIVFVLPITEINSKTPQEFLQNIKTKSREGSYDGKTRIDFDRAIYVLNKADTMTTKKLELFDVGSTSEFDQKPLLLAGNVFGDRMISLRAKDEDAMLQADICVMDQQTGFWFQNEKGTLIWDRGLEYLDCEYFREELTGMEKNLRVVSDFLAGKIDLAELLKRYSSGMIQNALNNI